MNPFDINREFESAIREYTGALFAVLTNSCTMALRLCLDWQMKQGAGRGEYEEIYGQPATVTIPKRTYVSVPMQIKAAGFLLAFRDEKWLGCYRLSPLPIWDSARWFTRGYFSMFGPKPGTPVSPYFVCVSFHATKTLGLKRPREDGGWDIEQGGAILHNSPEADAWLRRSRFDGRTEGVAPKDDHFDMIGHHAYMSPATARLGLALLKQLPAHNAPLPNDDYPDLSMHPVFRT
jgi:dTDP-4-amino-4,6-dideoxygalactose transaminase